MSIFNRNHLIALVAAATIAGCSSTPENPDADQAATAPMTESTTTAPAETATTTTETTNMSAAAEDPELKTLVIHFDFDKYDIRSGDAMVLDAHAKYLAAHPGAHLRIEGNTDERGTREYNMALGERRAKSAAAYLTSKGAASSQIEVISYGEERPVAMGHNEDAWAQNRRDDLNYTSEAP